MEWFVKIGNAVYIGNIRDGYILDDKSNRTDETNTNSPREYPKEEDF